MTIVIVNTGERGLLEHGLGVALELRLHTTDLTGLAPDSLDDLTTGDLDEPTFTGYTPVALPAAGWSITIGNPTEARQPPAVFTCIAVLPRPVSANSAARPRWHAQRTIVCWKSNR